MYLHWMVGLMPFPRVQARLAQVQLCLAQVHLAKRMRYFCDRMQFLVGYNIDHQAEINLHHT